MQMSALFEAKNFGFFKIYGVSVWTRRVEPVRTTGKKGQFFAILCGHLLWTTYFRENNAL